MNESTAWADANGLRIRYAVVGDGPPVVLVHGWGSDRRGNWDATGWTERLCADHRVVTLDVRGRRGREAARCGSLQLCGDGGGRDRRARRPRHRARGFRWLLHGRLHRGMAVRSSTGAVHGHGARRGRRRVAESIARAAPIAAGLRSNAAAIDDPVGRAVRAFVDQDPNIDADALRRSPSRRCRCGGRAMPWRSPGPSISEIPVPLLAVVGTRDEPYTSSVGAFVDRLAQGRALMLEGEDHLGAVGRDVQGRGTRLPAAARGVSALAPAPARVTELPSCSECALGSADESRGIDRMRGYGRVGRWLAASLFAVLAAAAAPAPAPDAPPRRSRTRCALPSSGTSRPGRPAT